MFVSIDTITILIAKNNFFIQKLNKYKKSHPLIGNVFGSENLV